jgi:hypothetical protein
MSWFVFSFFFCTKCAWELDSLAGMPPPFASFSRILVAGPIMLIRGAFSLREQSASGCFSFVYQAGCSLHPLVVPCSQNEVRSVIGSSHSAVRCQEWTAVASMSFVKLPTDDKKSSQI